MLFAGRPKQNGKWAVSSPSSRQVKAPNSYNNNMQQPPLPGHGQLAAAGMTIDSDADAMRSDYHEATAATAAAPAIGGRRLPLHSPADATYLSPLVCLMRSQLEVFSATPEDVQARSSYGKLVQKIGVGRVGIRCVHCRDRPAAEQARGAVSHPASIRMLNQATRNWQRFHWAACQFIPPSAREEFDRLTSGKKAHSSRKSQEYWIRRSGEMGLVDTAAAACAARVASSSPDYTSADSGGTFSSAERPVEPGGIYFEEDAKKLGLRILMPPEEKATGNSSSAAAFKKKKNATRATSQGSKRKSAPATSNEKDIQVGDDERKAITKHDQDTAALPVVNFDSLNVLPAMGKDFSMDDLGDDASFMSDLERLAGDDGGNEEGGGTSSIDISDNLHHHISAQALVNGGMNTATASTQDSSMSERDLKLLTTLRAAREMVHSLRYKYPYPSYTSTSTGSQLASDLHSLGKALYSTLEDEGNISVVVTPDAVRPITDDSNDDNRLAKRERRRHDESQRMRSTAPLQDLGYPTSVSIFVQSLIDATDEDAAERFTSISDVDRDLQLMIESPSKYLFDAPPEAPTGKLGVSSELYGIQTQRSKLMNAFRSVVVTGEEPRGLALISGRSGSGKTSLVETLVHPLRERRGRLIEIKFDKKDSQSMPSIFRALDQYCHELQGDLDLLNEVGAAVKMTLGSSSQVLLTLMPNLSALIGDTSSTLPAIENKEKYHLLLNGLQAFVRSISAPSHPIAILFDDLQWADADSLALMTKIVKDPATKCCLFVGCYRDNEVLADHPLLEYLGDVAFAGVPMWQIFQESIGKRSINELLSDTLHLLPRITAPLAREIHKKSGGNPNFAKQLLQSLHDERLLQYSPSTRRWQWDLAAIRSKNVPDDAVALLLERMTQYGPDVQRVLQVAALMGRRFDASALQMFQAGGDADGDGSAILAHIDSVVDDGLVCIDKAELRFAHDSIWEAALSLTPVFERERMNLLIGRQMLHAASSDSCTSLDIHLRLIVDQINAGSSLIETYDEKLGLAELNLRVGQQALAAYSFLEATMYLLQGSALLSEESWDSHYRLCLEIFTACAEAQLANGNNVGATISANAVISHGRCLIDKLSAYFTICEGLVAQGEFEEACHKTIGVLNELGIRLPSLEAQIEPATIRSELMKTEKMILSLGPNPKDVVTRAAAEDSGVDCHRFTMRFLLSLRNISYAKPEIFTLAVFQMVQISMKNAMTSEGPIAFATYSMVLCKLGLRDRSASCAEIALALLDKFHGTHSHSLVLALATSIWPYRQPWHACLDSFERAIRDATSVGDTSIVIPSYGQISTMHLFAPVSTLQHSIGKLTECQQYLKSRNPTWNLKVILFLQIALNLTKSDANGDPTIFRGDATNQTDYLSMLPQSDMFYPRLVRKNSFARLYLAYVFRRHDVVLEFASKVNGVLTKSKKEMYPTLDLLIEKYYLALAAFSIIRQGSDAASEDWQTIADELMNEMKGLSENDSKWNFQQKYFLLEAEKAFTDGNVEVATASYDRAIEAAKEHRFINEQALASECAALFYLDHENVGQARRYLEQARDLYVGWGALRKVGDIEGLLMTL